MLSSRLLIVYCVVGAIGGLVTFVWGAQADAPFIQFIGGVLVSLTGTAYRNAERIGHAFSEKQAERLTTESHRAS